MRKGVRCEETAQRTPPHCRLDLQFIEGKSTKNYQPCFFLCTMNGEKSSGGTE